MLSTPPVRAPHTHRTHAPHARAHEAYRPASYDRLVEVKTNYDPDNMFRSNQNIAPKA